MRHWNLFTEVREILTSIYWQRTFLLMNVYRRLFTRKKLKLYNLNIYFLNIVDIKYTSLDILDTQK